jgi:hypothetical protein
MRIHVATFDAKETESIIGKTAKLRRNYLLLNLV